MDIGPAGISERALALGNARALAGIVTTPARGSGDPARPALVILNAGLVHRVGPNRLHVRLARRMAERGFVAVRFDFSGIGESPPRADSLPFAQSSVMEVMEVMDAVTELTGIQRFCLLGLSSGALVSLVTALNNSRVVGTVIVNPHGFDDSGGWQAHVERLSEGNIYARNLLSPHSWQRLLTGRTDYRRLARSLCKAEKKVSTVVHAMRPALTAFLALGIRILLLFSEKDRSIVNFDEILGERWQERLSRNVTLAVIREANHTFAGPAHLGEAVAAVERWMEAGWAGAVQGAPARKAVGK
jgi:pimeloyl-ACP methyl ester carboxylesterase